MLDLTNVAEIQRQKEELKKKWEFHQEYMLHMMQEALHWQSSAESYDSLVRDYYIARQKHQKDVMRLNQILYGPGSATVHAYSNEDSFPFTAGGPAEEMAIDQGNRLPLRETMALNSPPELDAARAVHSRMVSRKRKDMSPPEGYHQQHEHGMYDNKFRR